MGKFGFAAWALLASFPVRAQTFRAVKPGGPPVPVSAAGAARPEQSLELAVPAILEEKARPLPLEEAHLANPLNAEDLRPAEAFTRSIASRLFGSREYDPAAPGFQVLDVPFSLLSPRAKDGGPDEPMKRAQTFAANLMSSLLPVLAAEHPEALPAPGDFRETYQIRKGDLSASGPTEGSQLHWDSPNDPVLILAYYQDPARAGGESVLVDFPAYIRDHHPEGLFLGINKPRLDKPTYDALMKDYSVRVPIPSDRVRMVVIRNMPHPLRGGILHGALPGDGPGMRRLLRVDVTPKDYFFASWRNFARVPYVTPAFEAFIERQLELQEEQLARGLFHPDFRMQGLMRGRTGQFEDLKGNILSKEEVVRRWGY